MEWGERIEGNMHALLNFTNAIETSEAAEPDRQGERVGECAARDQSQRDKYLRGGIQ